VFEVVFNVDSHERMGIYHAPGGLMIVTSPHAASMSA